MKRWQIITGIAVIVALISLFLLYTQVLEPTQIIENYKSAIALVEDGNCEEAQPLLEKLEGASKDIYLEDNRNAPISTLASRELRACEKYVEAQAFADRGDWIRAINEYITLNSQLTQLAPHVRGQIIAILDEKTVDELVTPLFCRDVLELLIDLDLMPTDDLVTKPDLYLLCADDAVSDESFGLASRLYQHFIESYPDHEAVDRAKAGLVDAMLKIYEGQSAGNIEQPLGIPSAIEDKALVSISNASPTGIELIFAGEEVEFISIPQCDTCTTVNDSSLGECSADAPQVTIELEAGTYQVLVRSKVESIEASFIGIVVPYRGMWELEAGLEYPNCFYIITQPSDE